MKDVVWNIQYSNTFASSNENMQGAVYSELPLLFFNPSWADFSLCSIKLPYAWQNKILSAPLALNGLIFSFDKHLNHELLTAS